MKREDNYEVEASTVREKKGAWATQLNPSSKQNPKPKGTKENKSESYILFCFLLLKFMGNHWTYGFEHDLDESVYHSNESQVEKSDTKIFANFIRRESSVPTLSTWKASQTDYL